MAQKILTVETLQSEALAFARIESIHPEPDLYGVTDGKAVGTYLEAKFKAYLEPLTTPKLCACLLDGIHARKSIFE